MLPIWGRRQLSLELEYNMLLKYKTTNANGDLLYKDPFERFVVNLTDNVTPFDSKPCVNHQDSYMGKCEAKYVVTQEPWSGQHGMSS